MITFYLISIFVTLLHAFIDTVRIKKNKAINHILESIIYSFILGMCMIFLKLNFWYCAITVTIIRTGWFDFSLNLFRGLGLIYNADGEYDGTKESFYDYILYKLNIHPIDIRISFFVLSVVWAFTYKFYFNG